MKKILLGLLILTVTAFAGKPIEDSSQITFAFVAKNSPAFEFRMTDFKSFLTLPTLGKSFSFRIKDPMRMDERTRTYPNRFFFSF